MHDGLQEAFDRSTVEPLAVQRHGLNLTGCGLGIDRIGQLDFTARAGRLST